MATARRYPKATWLGDGKSGGSYASADGVLGPYRVVFHTTETSGRPGYSDGKSAPHLTYNPKDRTWVQHTHLDVASRALKNEYGGVQTNRERALQVEIICYSNKLIADQRDYRLWVGDLPSEAYEDLAEFLAWTHASFDVEMNWPGKRALSYSAANVPGFRMRAREWDSFAGVCGHQHVPENYHWDPGALDWWHLMALANAILQQEEVVALKPYEQAAVDQMLELGIFTPWSIDEEGELDEPVALKTLAVFMSRLLAVVPVGAAGADGEDGKVEVYIDGEKVS